jgi:hypothetical protein
MASADESAKMLGHEMTRMDTPRDETPVASAAPEETQEGVKAMEAISMTWSKWGLIAAYLGIFLMAFTTSLEGQVTYSVVAFATSSFSSHSLIATVYVIQGVVNGKSVCIYLLSIQSRRIRLGKGGNLEEINGV